MSPVLLNLTCSPDPFSLNELSLVFSGGSPSICAQGTSPSEQQGLSSDTNPEQLLSPSEPWLFSSERISPSFERLPDRSDVETLLPKERSFCPETRSFSSERLSARAEQFSLLFEQAVSDLCSSSGYPSEECSRRGGERLHPTG